ncbi:hypothetical protein COCCU_00330 [Corynebacterium occultum]|uniref:Uncharacterized protein n=1 Tax=Corynebacterium occultum TaxID=2675219 RepID=A0A6B8VXG4_9CORY|nr:hypothetical protein COCCU_00330 [Corynebacterium occultum]
MIGTLLRVLRMLITHVEEDKPELVPTLDRQRCLLLESLAHTPGIHPEDLRRLRSLASDDSDPADHSR